MERVENLKGICMDIKYFIELVLMVIKYNDIYKWVSVFYLKKENDIVWFKFNN